MTSNTQTEHNQCFRFDCPEHGRDNTRLAKTIFGDKAVTDAGTAPRNEIDDAYIRHYSDNGQTTAYVEWSDGSRTEGNPDGVHMQELFRRAKRDGITIRKETW